MEDSVIRPVLTAKEWSQVGQFARPSLYDDAVGDDERMCAYLMALNNAALRDDSPYKITREDVTTLRLVVGVIMRYGEAQRMSDLADKLEAILPPETP